MSVKYKVNRFGHKSEGLFLRVQIRPGIDQRETKPETQSVELNFRNLLFLPARYLVVAPEAVQVTHQSLLYTKAQMLAYLIIKGCFKTLPLAEVLDWDPLQAKQFLLKHEVYITKRDQTVLLSTTTVADGKTYNQGLQRRIYHDFLKTVGGHARLYQFLTNGLYTINIRRLQ